MKGKEESEVSQHAPLTLCGYGSEAPLQSRFSFWVGHHLTKLIHTRVRCARNPLGGLDVRCERPLSKRLSDVIVQTA